MSNVRNITRFDIPEIAREIMQKAIDLEIADAATVAVLTLNSDGDWEHIVDELIHDAYTMRHVDGDAHGILVRMRDEAAKANR